ncbi:uncharacterized protein LOC101171122 [Oryzias latipes]|uniref:uncharacterized protein LOC101171122 n=1 Tax=Oryzias latipes TaxID=8090 RepID=UPI000CE16386|nr:uncharacterized protein LOC101171122 [Oryzias latipes]
MCSDTTRNCKMERHVTVLLGNEKPTPKTLNGSSHCPFCRYKGAEHAVRHHMENHSSVKHKGFTVIKCGLGCRTASHFHCCHCPATLVNRSQFFKHLGAHHVGNPPWLLEVKPEPPPQLPLAPPQLPEPSSQPPLAPPQLPEPSSQPPLAPPQLPEPSSQPPLAPPQLPEPSSQPPLAPSQLPLAPPQIPLSLSQLPDPSSQSPLAPSQSPLAPSQLPEPPSQSPLSPPQPPLQQPAQLLWQQTPAPPHPSERPQQQKNPKEMCRTQTILCHLCGLNLKKKNFKTHCKRKHKQYFETVSMERFLSSQCVDEKNGVFAVQESFCGSAKPVHVVKKFWGASPVTVCEVDQCRLNGDFAHTSGMPPYECHHVRSLLYCPRADNQHVTLSEEALETMVEQKWFGEEQKASLLQCKRKADAEEVPLSVQLTVGGPPSKIHISVYEPEITCDSRVGRLIVAYDRKQNSWHCSCSIVTQSCNHKAIAKWHLFVTNGELFQKASVTEAESPDPPQDAGEDSSPRTFSCPPYDESTLKMLNYLLKYKKLPGELPKALIEQSKNGRTQDSFPKCLIPAETTCVECEYPLGGQQIITSEARILTSTGVVEGISTYRKSCLKCGMIYRYQEWEDGVHNFDDHLILSLHLCLVIRNALQTHTAVSEVIDVIQTTDRLSFPNTERILQAYLHFEALTKHDYTFACVSCGYSPAVVVMDLHKKGVLGVPVSEIQIQTPDEYDFWNAVAREMLSRGFNPVGRKNPFVGPPSHHHWSAWTGPHTGQSNSVLNNK